jgi:hypothetical protein
MQLMTWPLARLGSRFGLLFEPHHRRVMHSALGRFMDQPLDLAVGLIDEQGNQRVLPLTAHGTPLYACQQFERINSITFRGYDQNSGLMLELNLHSPFYPQNEQLCLMPAMYVELRIRYAKRVRWLWNPGKSPTPDHVKLFIRLNRPDTQIAARPGAIDLEYDVPLDPKYKRLGYDALETARHPSNSDLGSAHVCEQLRSLNEGAEPVTDEHGGQGLMLEMPVTEQASGIKWRLVWAAHTDADVMEVHHKPAKFRYVRHWPDLPAVMDHAIANRDDYLILSRRFEKLLDQTPLTRSRWHLLSLGFQSYLSQTFWCDVEDGTEWFSNWEGSCFYHSTVDVEYNLSLLYFVLWPKLLRMTLDEWTAHGKEHEESGGLIMSHDMGRGLPANGQAYHHDMPLEENANFLLLLQAYTHWTGDTQPVQMHSQFIRRLAQYLLWTDRDASGFASEGSANTIDDAAPAVQYARKQTYLAVKRVTALDAAADLLERVGDHSMAQQCRDTASLAVPKIEQAAWLGDHYAVCVDRDATGVVDVWTGKPLPYEELPGWDDYSIYTSNGLLLPMLTDRPMRFKKQHMVADVTNALRETLTPYGCGHSSSDTTNVWISQNLWRDHTGRYLGAVVPLLDARYWDLQVFSNTGDQSFAFIDTYIGNELCFYPRGATTFGYFLAGPRITIDRLAERGPQIVIRPDRYRNSRWPLLPLADWEAGRIPVCVVDSEGRVHIEGEIEPVTIAANQ